MTAVTGTYLLPGDGATPATGYVRFTLRPAALDTDGNQRVCAPVYASLDPATGSFSVDLVPDADLVVDGEAVYEVAEFIDGCHRAPWYLFLADDTPVDLPSRYPGTTVSGAAVLPVPGDPGASAYELAVQAGFTGTEAEWLASLEGGDGPPNSLSVGTVSTLPPGAPATADVTGTPPAQTLSLGIPQGEPGADLTGGGTITGPLYVPAPTTAGAVPRLARTPNPATGDLGLPGWAGSDTGWREVTGLLVNGWTADAIRIRRTDTLVQISAENLTGTEASSTLWLAVPQGYRPSHVFYQPLFRNNAASQAMHYVTTTGSAVSNSPAGNVVAVYGSLIFTVAQAWPATLPGTQTTPPAEWT